MTFLTPLIRRGGSSSKRASLITLTVQNSALILIMHYSRIMPSSGDHRYFTSTAVFLNELVKLSLSLCLAINETSESLAPDTPITTLLEQVYNSVFGGDGWKLAIPAAGYTLQNLLQYVAISNLDAVQFQVLYQLKILTTAIFSVTLLRKQLGTKRWLSLVVLTLGVCVVSMPTNMTGSFLSDTSDSFFPRSIHDMGTASPELYMPKNLRKRSATYQGVTEDLGPPEPTMNYSAGVIAVLVAGAVSGVTGVYFEKLIKEGPSQPSLWIRNVQLSTYSLIMAFFMGIVYQDGAGIREHGFFEGYNWVVWTAVVLQAVGGMVASVVIRDADNIVKNFATSISIVLSLLVSVFLFDFRLTWTYVIGTGMVLLSMHLYSTPHRFIPGHRPKPIRIVSLEKPAVTPLHTPRLGVPSPHLTGSPRVRPLDSSGRTHLDPFDMKGLGSTSSRPESPMLPRIPSRSDIKRAD